MFVLRCLIIWFPWFDLSPILLPIRPTPLVDSQLSFIISCLRCQLRSCFGPHPSLTEENYAGVLTTVLGRKIWLEEAEAGKEVIGRHEHSVRMGGNGDVHSSRNSSGSGKLGWFADVNNDWGTGRGEEAIDLD